MKVSPADLIYVQEYHQYLHYCFMPLKVVESIHCSEKGVASHLVSLLSSPLIWVEKIYFRLIRIYILFVINIAGWRYWVYSFREKCMLVLLLEIENTFREMGIPKECP